MHIKEYGKCTSVEELKNGKCLQFEGNNATKILNNELIYNLNCWNFKKLYLQYNLNRKVNNIGSIPCMYYISVQRIHVPVYTSSLMHSIYVNI